jgi:hypothetical protein
MQMHRSCRLIVIGFSVMYALAAGLFVVGNFGLFGSPSGPLAGIFLLPLGLPWNRMLDIFPEPLWPTLAALAPAMNLIILMLICRWSAQR